MGEVFVRRLRGIDGKAKAGLGEALKSASSPAIVRSAFDLPAEQRAMIQTAVNETFAADVRLRFETAPELISGVELATDGQKLGWSIKDYLVSLEQGVDELLQEKNNVQVQAKKPSELSRRIGERAYELYEEHGRKDGRAGEDWAKAEHEMGNENPNPAQIGPKSEEAKPDTGS